MKRKLTALCAILTATLLTGCSADTSKMDSLIEAQSTTLAPLTEPAATETASADSAPEGVGGQDASAGSAPTSAPAPQETPANIDVSNGEYDVDLTTLDSNMVYAECYAMVYSPEEYAGKTIRVHGPFAYFKDEVTGKEYFAVLISDAAACCSQGIEFVLAGDHTYPDDYPETATEITVSGKFNHYEENGSAYVQLLDAVIE